MNLTFGKVNNDHSCCSCAQINQLKQPLLTSFFFFSGLTPATFGATEPLNLASSRQRRDTESMRNASFAKFLTNGTMFGATGELSFFIRTRELRRLIIFMTDSKSNHISVSINEGLLAIHTTLNGKNSSVRINETVSDGQWHFVEIQGNMSRFDNRSLVTEPIADKDINLTFTYIGGLDDFSLYPEANLIRTPFRGCLQDIRLNNKLFDFKMNDAGSLNSIDRYMTVNRAMVARTVHCMAARWSTCVLTIPPA